jgi:hypothetical protein
MLQRHLQILRDLNAPASVIELTEDALREARARERARNEGGEHHQVAAG